MKKHLPTYWMFHYFFGFFIILLIAISGDSYAKAQVDYKINIKMKSVPIKHVFNKIQKETGLIFTYSNDQFDQETKVSIDFSNTLLNEVLDFTLKGTELEWKLDGANILIYRKKINNTVGDYYQDSLFSISGKILNKNGSPISGATILIKNSKKGTKSNPNGAFLLENVSQKGILFISCIGFKSKEFIIGNSRFFEIQLNDSIGNLDATIVTAYTTTTIRDNVGGGIGVVRADDIEKQPVTNPLLALQARVPGVVIEQATGIANSGVKIRIRGQNSLLNGLDPLYVIDGVPFTSQLFPNFNNVIGGSGAQVVSGGLVGNGNPLSFINPNDIESITILKDADATSIYGSRAAAGAVLITTKKGQVGDTKVTVNFQEGWGKVPRKIPLLDAKQYLLMRNESLANDGILPSATDYDLNGTWDTSHITDWQKVLIGGTSKYTEAQLSASGGSNLTQFLIGANYHKETTVFPGSFNDQKGSVHFNINHQTSNKKLKLQFSGNYLVDDNRLPRTDLTFSAVNLPPVAPALYKSDGSLNWEVNTSGLSTWTNPLAVLIGKSRIKTNNLLGNLLASYQIVKGLNVKSSFGFSNLLNNEILTYPIESNSPESRAYSKGAAGFGNSNIKSWIVEPQLTYDLNIASDKLSVLIGSTFQENKSQFQRFLGLGYNSDILLEDIRSASNLLILNTTDNVYKYNAAFGRIYYNMDSKYMIEFTCRRDGSSRFGSDNLFHNFWSLAGAWTFSNEKLIKDNFPILSYGKLRASYGTSGNDQIGDYQFLNLYSTIPLSINYQGSTSLKVNGLPNPQIQWEETKKLQLGVDLGLVRDKVLLNVNYFRHRSSNQLLSYNLPIISGFNSVLRNFPATLQNSGLEVELNTVNISKKDFEWTSSLNLTLARNKLVKFNNLASSPYASTYVIGKPVDIQKVYRFIGVDPITGLYLVASTHGGSTSAPDYFSDRTVLYSPTPKFYGGLQNSLSYKGIRLDFLFQFVKQQSPSNYFGGVNGPGKFDSNYGNQPASVMDRWQKEGDNKTIQRFSAVFPANVGTAYGAAALSDRAIVDGSYIRLKSLSLSWQVPELWCQKLKFSELQVYLHSQNLLTFSKYKLGDPEVRSINTLPPLRVITTGIKITF